MTTVNQIQQQIQKIPQTTIDEKILDAIVKAREICEIDGKDSSNCIQAWNLIQELQIEKAQEKQAKLRKTDLEIYCENHPEALECLIYDT